MKRVFSGQSSSRASLSRAWSAGAAAFTLIELLVVILIIGILMALVLPVFFRIQENGRKTTCMNNLRQVAQAIMLYVGEHDATYPPRTTEIANFASEGAQPNWLKAIVPYLKEKRSLLCPSVNEDHGSFKPTEESSTTYLGNAAVMGRRTAGIPNSAGTIMVQEIAVRLGHSVCRPTGGATATSSFTTWQYKKPDGSANYSNNHAGGGNVVFCDGHAEYKQTTELRSGDFGLLPDDDTVAAPSNKAYKAAFE